MRTVLAVLFALATALQVACIDLKAIKEDLATPIPSQCTSLCSGPQQTLDDCTQTPQFPSCLCTPTILANIFNCLKCIGAAKNTTNYTLAQSDLDQITSACDASGSHLDPLTLPGQDPNRVIATTQIGGSTTASVSQTSSLPTQTVPSSLPPTATGTQTAGGKGNGASQHKACRGVLMIAALASLVVLR